MACQSPRRPPLCSHILHSEDYRHYQQSRSFCFGPWSGAADVHTRRHHHALRYRYMDSLKRKLSWDNGSRDSTFPGCVGPNSRLWRTSQPPHGAYTSIDDIKAWSDDISILHASKDTGHASSLKSSRESVQSATVSNPEENTGFIDPITNRRRMSESTAPTNFPTSPRFDKTAYPSQTKLANGQTGLDSAVTSKTGPDLGLLSASVRASLTPHQTSTFFREPLHQPKTRSHQDPGVSNFSYRKGSEYSLQLASQMKPMEYDDLKKLTANTEHCQSQSQSPAQEKSKNLQAGTGDRISKQDDNFDLRQKLDTHKPIYCR